ncbi:hypothetical protein [Hoeflea sp.]|uniref:hypothetical protein n=1 Tax=Hoeflea sp. TaxID=1940281 RepID=UPI003A8E50EC
MREFLSDHLKATRDAFKRHVHGGKTFSSEEIIGVLERFDELVALARSQENELSRHQWNELARREALIAQAGNVVSFPGSHLGGSRHPSDGGNAA